MQYIKSIQTTFAHIALSVVLTESEKLYFITIFKSQLSSTELILWGYDLHFGICHRTTKTI